MVLERLRQNHLYIKLEKCEFHRTEIQFLGYVMSSQGISMDESKTQAIEDWPAPKNVTEVQRFIGFANFYRRVIRNFSERLSSAERNYDVGNRELLAIIAAFKEWRHLLQGTTQQIIVLTDHRNLEFTRPGSRNGKAEAPSRIVSTDTIPFTPPKTILPDSWE
ncbi:uncharacterized protein ACNLHF_005659 [Anomaloglossus baeobatrachus]